jgi:hypothetical protein
MIDDLRDHESLGRVRRPADWMFDQFSWAAKGAVVEIRAGVGTFSPRPLAAGVESLLLIEPDDVCADLLAERFGTDPRVSITRETLPDSPTLAKSSNNVLECRRSLRRRPHDRGSRASRARDVTPSHSRRLCLKMNALYLFNLLGVPGWLMKTKSRAESVGVGSLIVYEALVRAWRPIEDRVRLPLGLSLVAHAEKR